MEIDTSTSNGKLVFATSHDVYVAVASLPSSYISKSMSSIRSSHISQAKSCLATLFLHP